MVEFVGKAGGRAISVEVLLDSRHVGSLMLTLGQWDRLRAHRREASASTLAGLTIAVEADPDYEPVDVPS
jgi:hypothetical protein